MGKPKLKSMPTPTRRQILRERSTYQLAVWLEDTGKFPHGVYPLIDNLVCVPRFMPQGDIHIEHLRLGGWRVGTCFSDGKWSGWVEAGKHGLERALMQVVLLAILKLLDDDSIPQAPKKGGQSCPGKKNGKS